jgi:phage/plasmid-like protein (TIGR03299 family)
MPANFESGFFVGKPAWHGLGTTLPQETQLSVEEGLTAAGLDWQVDLLPLEIAYEGVQKPGIAGTRVPAFATVRQSDQAILGVVGMRYNVLQNLEAFEWFQPFLDASEATLHTAGSLHDGKRIWVLAKLNREPIEVAEGDTVEKFLLLSNSHDGSTCVRVGFCPIRVVCANTLAMAHQVGQLLRLRHTSSLQATLGEVRDIVNTANNQFEATAEQYRKLAARPIDPADVGRYVKQVVLDVPADTEFEKLTTRKANILSDVIQRYQNPIGSGKVSSRPSWWRAYNAVTEFYSYSAGRNNNTRLKSLWYGDNQKRSTEALKAAVELSEAV